MKLRLLHCLLATFLIVSLFGSAAAFFPEEPGDWDPFTWYNRNDRLENFDQLNESPMLRERVEAGELPPVEERLPKDVLVLEPLEEVGQYGGEWRTAFVSAAQWTQPVSGIMGPPALSRGAIDGQHIPLVAKGWEMSEDQTEATIYLREGMRWSDGEPFTTADFMFWYENVFGDEHLMPSPPMRWTPGGEPMEMEAVDDYTLHFTFAAPHPVFPNYIRRHLHYAYYPSHYMSQYHPNFVSAEEMDALLDDYGLEEWWQLFDLKSEQLYWRSTQRQPGQPTLLPYVVTEREGDVVIMERNPYYYKVDHEGNQLPYIDTLRAEALADAEVRELKAIAGEVDYHDGQASNLPMYIENEEEGNYKTYIWRDSEMAVIGLFPNLTHTDPVLREIFQDVRFRQALSLAIDREEINDLVYFGLAEPRQGTVIPPSPLYREEFARAYADYDPERANELLDEMGLERGDDGIRRRPDGEPLRLTLDCRAQFIDRMAGSELIVDYWQDLGLDVTLEGLGAEYQYEQIVANEHDITVWGSRMVGEQMPRFSTPFVPAGSGANPRSAPLWAQWYESGGEAGEEPPPWMMEVYDLWTTVQTTPDDDERQEALFEMVKLQAENLWFIGTVGMNPVPLVINADIKNVPDGLIMTFNRDYTVEGNVDTWFFDQ